MTKPLLAMLRQERTSNLREYIVMLLGRLEDPQAQPLMQELLAQARQSSSGSRGLPAARLSRSAVPLYRVQLALGRVRSRAYRGERKLNVIAKSVGTTWPGIKSKAARLRVQLADRKRRYEAVRSDDHQVVQEFHDVLYRMGKRGENIQLLGASDLRLRSQQEPLLAAAALSDAAEVRFWLQRAMPPSKAGFTPSHLLDLGPTVPAELMKYLRTALAMAKTKPQVIARTRAYRSAFDAAAASGNRKFIPVLKEFQKVNDTWARRYAEIALERF